MFTVIFRGYKKKMQNEQTEPNEVWATRRRTKVRRVAKFVYSIKHKNEKFKYLYKLKGILTDIFSVESLLFILFYAVCAFLHPLFITLIREH